MITSRFFPINWDPYLIWFNSGWVICTWDNFHFFESTSPCTWDGTHASNCIWALQLSRLWRIWTAPSKQCRWLGLWEPYVFLFYLGVDYKPLGASHVFWTPQSRIRKDARFGIRFSKESYCCKWNRVPLSLQWWIINEKA